MLETIHDLSALELVILTLATTRVTRAITQEDVGGPFRTLIFTIFHRTALFVGNRRFDGEYGIQEAAFVEKWANHGDTLSTCPWCLGMWCSVIALTLLAFFPTLTITLCAPFAFSYVVGVLESWF